MYAMTGCGDSPQRMGFDARKCIREASLVRFAGLPSVPQDLGPKPTTYLA
jgi:hypothetical protein